MTAGTGISITGATDKITINHSNSVTAVTSLITNSSTETTTDGTVASYSGSIKVFDIKYDA